MSANVDSDSSSVSSNSEPENELSTYERIRNQINYISYNTTGYEVCRETKLAQALDNLAGSPIQFFESRPGMAATFKLLVKGEDAGTWFKPDVEVLKKHATTSPFGRGEETVIDPTYRNGTELKADELAFGLKENWELRCRYGWFLSDIREQLQATMFVGKNVFFKFYKLAIYGEGGHFDWHRDSTHSDAHHGTVLVSLNTEWDGGDLMLRHQGVEIAVDMHPKAYSNEYDEMLGDEFTDVLQPVVVAFYTDTEHKVMPVTKGTRLVLQYDVEVEQSSDSESIPPRYNSLDVAVKRHEYITSQITFPNLDPKMLQAVVDEIRVLQEEGSSFVAFPLTHLYRKASIKEEYLKGTDSALFDALKNHFDVFLRPVLIRSMEHADDDNDEEFFAHEYKPYYEEEPSRAKQRRRGVYEDVSFHLPRAFAIMQLSLPDWQYLGNESQSGEARYYSAGMFVEPKSEK
ncbi:hypothetical protein P692DRAFT_20840250 [Suillus brevipes Sb2]|nr:hypothetical protein P692DRAFT_20840250 [Suillus brevipes Sb2]